MSIESLIFTPLPKIKFETGMIQFSQYYNQFSPKKPGKRCSSPATLGSEVWKILIIPTHYPFVNTFWFYYNKF